MNSGPVFTLPRHFVIHLLDDVDRYFKIVILKSTVARLDSFVARCVERGLDFGDVGNGSDCSLRLASQIGFRILVLVQDDGKAGGQSIGEGFTAVLSSDLILAGRREWAGFWW